MNVCVSVCVTNLDAYMRRHLWSACVKGTEISVEWQWKTARRGPKCRREGGYKSAKIK
jgi:hypothetical protein